MLILISVIKMEQFNEFLKGIFDTSLWPQRWNCGIWTDFHGWVYIISDLLIGLAYVGIPIIIVSFVVKRDKDVSFQQIFWLFGSFILLCGLTHFMEVSIFWWPAYRLAALIKFLTAIASVGTLIALYRLLPDIFSLKTAVQFERELEQRIRAEQELRDLQFYTRSLIESNIDAFMTFDLHGTITDVNQQMEKLTEYPRVKLMGTPFKNYIKDKRQAEKTIEEVLKNGKINDCQLTILDRSGRETPVSINATTFFDHNGNLQGVIAAARNISLLQEASRMKSEFLSTMSHELRTPLNSILILSKLLEENKNQRLSEKEIEYAKIIQKSGKDLLSLINDILDLNKIEAGKVDLVKEKVYFKQLTENMYNTFNNDASSKNIQFKIEIAPSLKEEYIYSDMIKLEQVLRNLLSNAFKFTGKGGLVILRITEEKNKNNLTKQHLLKAESVISFSVLDTGIGIPENKLELIFAPFQQVDSSTSRKYGGTGLGLHITYQLVNLLGGELKVKSKENEGSEFTIYLKELDEQKQQEDDSYLKENTPVHQIQSRQIAEYKDERYENRDKLEEEKEVNAAKDKSVIPDLSDNVLSGKTILLAEDDMRSVFSLSAALGAYGIQIIHAGDGKEALQKLDEEKSIDMVLMDIMMPEMSGYEAMEEIRKRPEYKGLPIIALTAKAMKGDKEKCIEAGASDYISKPLDVRELLMLMAKYLVLFPFPMLILEL